MILTLLRKELLEHGWVFAILMPVTVIGFLLIVVGTSLNEVGSVLDSVRFFAISFHLLVTLVVCNRLVVQEYSGKTQLFLEGLPISRSAMMVTKYVLGFVLVISLMAFCFIVALALASRQEMIDSRFVQIMAYRLFAYIFLSYSFFFMMGLLGRYRIAIYLVILLSCMILSDATSFDLTKHGPFALLDSQFAFERVEFPTRNILGCCLTGCVFTAVGMAMGLMREGSIASLLAEKMSQREKLFASTSVLMLLFVGSSLDAKRVPDPYSIPGAYLRNENNVAIQIELSEFKGPEIATANAIHEDWVSISRYLEIQQLPPLFLVNRGDLDSDQYEKATLKNASGVLLRMNYRSSDFQYATIRPDLIDIGLSYASNFNAVYEPQCWLLEGFSEFWPRRETFGIEWSNECEADLRAAYCASIAFEPIDVKNWYQFRDRVGSSIARAVACSGLVLAQRKYGDEKLQRFLQQALRLDQPSDARADWAQWRRPIDKIWNGTMGSDYNDFLNAWAKELKTQQTKFATKLKSVPKLSARSQWNAQSAITYALKITPKCTPAPSDGNVTIKYEEIGVFDTWTSERNFETQVQLYEFARPIEVSDTFSAGDRVRWTASVFSPALGCDVLSGWQRQEVK